jgi:hypothetical protein
MQSGRNYMVTAQALSVSVLFSLREMASLVPLPGPGGAMEPAARHGIAVLAACLALGWACNRQTGLPATDPARSDTSQKLPFDRQPQSAGVSPSHSLIPSVTRLPEGTPLTIYLQNDLSSASAHEGDSFAATLDSPIVIDGQTLVSRGAPVFGRVLEAKHSTGPLDPGYLRLALVSLTVGAKAFPIATSSLFAKGSREDRSSPLIGADRGKGAKVSPTATVATTPAAAVPKEIVLGPDRRLSFRLTQSVDLQ